MSTISTTSSENASLLHKVFIAGCRKQFIGKGAGQWTKDEIKELDIAGLAIKIESEVGDFRKPAYCGLNPSITYFLGLCRIYEKAVTFLHEDVIALNEKLNSLLYATDGVSSKKKGKKGRKDFELDDLESVQSLKLCEDIDDLESVQSLKLCEDIDLVLFFERASHKLKTDQNLITEVDVHWAPVDLPDFGDELHLQNGHLAEVIEGIHAGPLGIAPSVSGESIGESSAQPDFDIIGPDAIFTVPTGQPPSTQLERRDKVEGSRSIKSTPKRKPDKSLDDTPSKRQRKPASDTDPSDKKSAASRRLFDPDKPSSSSPTAEAMREDQNQHGEEPFHEPVPVQKIQEESPRTSIQIIVEAAPDDQTDRELEQPVPVASSQNIPQLPDTSYANLDDMQLEELDDESLALKRRRAKKKVVFDTEKQIEKFDYSNIQQYSKLHTKEMEIPNLEKIEKKSLSRLSFSLPATGIKRKGPCAWGKTLQNLYFEMARPVTPVVRPGEDEFSNLTTSVHRDANVDKRPRFPSLGRKSGWGAREPSTPEAPEVTGEGIPDSSDAQNATSEGVGDNDKDRDKKLMPPPRSSFDNRPMLSRRSDEPTSPRTPGKSYDGYYKPPSLTSSPQPQSPGYQTHRTPTRTPMQPDTSAVSPRQVPGVHPFMEADTAEDQSLPNAVPMSPSASAKERSMLMKEDEFYKFLEDLWVTSLFNVKLDDIIVPQRSTLTKFYRYFGYLQRFQVAKKLTMVQEIIYGPVHIKKGIEE